MGTVYLNGKFMPQEQAMIPVMDRGFLFGDGVYESIPVFGGHCFRLDQHLDRLDYSLAQVRLPQPWPREAWHDLLAQLIDANGGGDQAVYVQITRGVMPHRQHAFSGNATPTVFAMSRPLAPPPAQFPAAVDCITLDDIRWQRCDIKTTALMGTVLMTQQAFDAGAHEAILLRDGCIWEGASSNVFAVVGGVLHTAPAGHHALAGVTRDLVLELAQRHGQPVREEALPRERFEGASEVWITSSTREIMPVAHIDGQPVGDGSLPVLTRIWQWYRSFRSGCKSSPAK